MSIKAYQRAATQADSPRELEYRAFGLVTAGLVRAQEAAPHEIGVITEALDANQRLWQVMAGDCALPDNKLPHILRAQIISLALWVERYTVEVLRERVEIDPLIDINRTMMEGLIPR